MRRDENSIGTFKPGPTSSKAISAPDDCASGLARTHSLEPIGRTSQDVALKLVGLATCLAVRILVALRAKPLPTVPSRSSGRRRAMTSQTLGSMSHDIGLDLAVDYGSGGIWEGSIGAAAYEGAAGRMRSGTWSGSTCPAVATLTSVPSEF